MRLLRRLWQKFVIPLDHLVYNVPGMKMRDVEVIQDALSGIRGITCPLFGIQEIDIVFDSTVVSEKTIREAVNRAGFETEIAELTYADRA